MTKNKKPHFTFQKEYKLTHNGEDAVIDPLPEMEICAHCKKVTDVPKDLDISERECYIEGAGQLCRTCYDLIYNTKLP